MAEDPTIEKASQDEAATDEVAPTLGQRIVRELKSRPVAWITAAALLVLSPIILKMIFPDATPGVLVAGTIAFTAYAAACTVPGRFL